MPFPSPADLPDPGIKPRSPSLQADALPSELLGKPNTPVGWTYFRHAVHKIPSRYPKYPNQIKFSTSTLVQLHFLNSELYIKTCEIFLDPGRWLSGKESACNAGDLGLIPGSGNSMEKEMATHSSILLWKIPRTEEPGRLQSMGL